MTTENKDPKTIVYVILGFGAIIALGIFFLGIVVLFGANSQTKESYSFEIFQPQMPVYNITKEIFS